MPKKLAHRKQHRPDVKDGVATSGNYVAFGSFGLKATTAAWVSAQQLEAARRVLAKYIRRGGKSWIRVFPHSAITAKGSQTTMGGGKGAPEKYIATVRPGNIIFELDGISEVEARQALTLAAYKLPIKAKVVKKQ